MIESYDPNDTNGTKGARVLTSAGFAVEGLTGAEVAARVAAGRVNGPLPRTSRSVRSIIRANALTRFNVLLVGLFLAMLAVRGIRDTLFIWVVLLNLCVGVAQELRARRVLDHLKVVDELPVVVRRDGAEQPIPGAELVEDDLFVVKRGDQIPVDGTVADAQGLEVDESLLTGESNAIAKHVGSAVLSGSIVVSGFATVRATAVGEHSYAQQLSREAREFKLAGSELRSGTELILRVVTWVMVPVGALLLWSQLVANESLASAVQGTVAGLSAMVPEGLVLLTSMAFAAGVIRLGRRKVLTRELAAVEGLARVDVLCVDKTGTLTEASMRVVTVELIATGNGPVDPAARTQAETVLAALAALDRSPNATMVAIGAAFSVPPSWPVERSTSFSSQRRWSSAMFAQRGTWVLGAPEALLESDALARIDAQLRAHTQRGERVVLLADAGCGAARQWQDDGIGSGPATDEALRPVALIALAERIKADVAETLEFFKRQGVTIKVLSGDNPATVAAIAAAAGLESGGDAVDASLLTDDVDALSDLWSERNVFGRVSPGQKRALIRAMQRKGHTVAMAGDGVNDLLALKDADVGIAMGEGSSASRAVAQFVLLDGGFGALPAVLAEGRRVLANVERVAGLFLTKTVYAVVLALATGVARLPFPLLPRQLSFVGALSIGVPGFILALERNAARARPGFVRRVLTMAVPSGLIAAIATFAAYADARLDGASLAASRTTATMVLVAVAGYILVSTMRPLNGTRIAMLGALGALFASALALPASRHYFEFVAPPAATWATTAGLTAVACVTLVLAHKVWTKLNE